MKKYLLRSMMAVLSASALAANGATTIRELWDDLPAGSLQGQTNGSTSFGFFPSAAVKWTVNALDPAATNALQISANNNADDWMIGRYDVLPSRLTVPSTLQLSQTTNGFESGSWAVRFLDTPARINMNTNGVYYFSVRLVKRALWWTGGSPVATNNYGPDDAALGIGFANGSSASSHFFGAGYTRTVAMNGGAGYLAEDGSWDMGDTAYITQGTLGQAGYTNHPADSGGPYYVRAIGYPQSVTGYLGGYPDSTYAYVNGGFLVGKLTTTVGGNATLQIRSFVSGDTIPFDEAFIDWEASYSFTDTVTMNYLLVWASGINNANPCYLDAIRVGTSWPEVAGVEVIGPPTASPTNTIYEGTPLTLSAATYVADPAATYQWLKNGGPISGATDTNYVIANPVTTDSGNYSLIYSNYWGEAVTSQVRVVTVNPYAAPVITAQPVGGSRYLGGPSFTMSVGGDGGRPLIYQWKHVYNGVTNVMTGQTNTTLVLTNLQTTDGGGYFATVSNLAGSTNSATATLQVIVPPAGSYAAAITARNPYAYWTLGETSGTVLNDYWSGLSGVVLDPTNYIVTYTTNGTDITTNVAVVGVEMGLPGLDASGFASPHYSIYPVMAAQEARANLTTLPVWTNGMTICCWIYTYGWPAGSGWNGTNGISGQGNKILMERDLNDYGGYGNSWGIGFWEHFADGTTNSYNYQNQLGYKWGGAVENPSAFWTGYAYTNSGLYVPSNQWTFVAWVINGSQTKMYMGTNNTLLTSANYSLASGTDANFPNTVYTNTAVYAPMYVGRNGWPYAEGSGGNGWGNTGIGMSDVAVFYSALTDSDIQAIYVSALNQSLTGVRSGNTLQMTWPYGTLQAAPGAAGTYTNVVGATSPYSTPITGTQQYFRVRR
ncbi:MAG: immunoglobulin domain-containing protein [Verrucomicrobiota bacterium]